MIKAISKATAIALSAFALNAVAGVSQASATVLYGEYGHGQTQVDCYNGYHRAYFTIDVLSEYGATVPQSIAYDIYTYQSYGGAWHYLGDTGIRTGTNRISGSWWTGTAAGTFAHYIVYSWLESNGQWVSKGEWLTGTYHEWNYSNGRWYEQFPATSYCTV
jgi:hypothetical protein